MTNSKTAHSRALRERTSREWTAKKVQQGYKRVGFLLPPDIVEALDRLAVIYGSRTAAITVAIHWIDAVTKE